MLVLSNQLFCKVIAEDGYNNFEAYTHGIIFLEYNRNIHNTPIFRNILKKK
jgi:hypothetical protein